MTQSDRSDVIVIEGELVHDWWEFEADQVSVDGQPMDDIIAVLPVADKTEREFQANARSTRHVVERKLSYGRVRLTIERLP